MRMWAVGVVLALLVAGACSSGDGDGRTGPTIPTDTRVTTTSTPSTTVAPVSYDVPEVIDQAYVQRVVSAYDKVLGDAIRVLKRDGGVSDEFLKHLLAIYAQPEFEVQQRAWAEEAEAGRAGKTPEDSADPSTTVIRLERADQSCVIVRADRTFAPTLRQGVEEVRTQNDQYLVLVPKRDRPDPLGLNPAPWVMSFDGSKNDNTVPINSCDD